MSFSLCYLTNRKTPRFDWFCDGIVRQCGSAVDFEVIVVDSVLWDDAAGRRQELADIVKGRFAYKHVPPKPSVFQGPHRLTKSDFFAASNARNTGICHSSKDYIYFIDDLSIMLGDFLSNVRHAAQGKYVVGGAYKKVLELVVENGDAKSWREFPQGLDSRLGRGSKEGIRPINGGALYGCSMGLPMGAMLQINGFDEIYDSQGGEDYSVGIALEKWGHKIWYNLNLMTLEDELAHGQGPIFKRIIKPGNPDSSWVVLNRLNGASRPRAFGNTFELAELRRDTLAGKPLPIPKEPKTHWFDGQPLSEMG